jgi:hypothetical protein
MNFWLPMYLALWSVSLALMIYALLRRRWSLLEVTVVAFLMLSFDVMMMLNSAVMMGAWIG